MKLLRVLLFPFSILYGIITCIRNFMYDRGILKSYSFSRPVIAIGNLSTGGTGKSPQTEYLIRLLCSNYKVATLSRGYKRKSKGFVLAGPTSNAEILGDEPYQFYTKFPHINVAVDADRKNGIEKLLALHPQPDVIILDDAYQHRKVKADFYILLTSYGDLYADDFILPTGNLRESRSGAKRANIIVVTKCPQTISLEEINAMKAKLNPDKGQDVFFTYIDYDNEVHSEKDALPLAEAITRDNILVAGIARPAPFFERLKGSNANCITFPDHHNFTEEEVSNLAILSKDKIIITTEKDYVRLMEKLPPDKLYYLPIKSAFIKDGGLFDAKILHFLENRQ